MSKTVGERKVDFCFLIFFCMRKLCIGSTIIELLVPEIRILFFSGIFVMTIEYG